MNESLAAVMEKRIQRTMEALRANRMDAFYLPTAAEVRPFVEQMIPEGAVVSNGGSVSLIETGVMDLLSSGRYHYLDRTKVPAEEVNDLYREVFSADWYLASTNAVTELGELYNVDGNANRVAALAFGPKNVLLVVGCNKIVADIPAAEARLKAVAAPANAARLNTQTPCAVTGKCEDCHSPSRICCTTLICRQQRIPGRIKVLLVGEPLGF